MNRTRMVASSISTILRRALPSTSRCISFVTSNSQTLLRRQPNFFSPREISSSVLTVSEKICPWKFKLFGRSFCSKYGDKTYSWCRNWDANPRCWNCDVSVEKMPFVFCDSCGGVQPVDDLVDFDYFQFFGLEKKYEIDISRLEEKYKYWKNKLHPDVFRTKSKEEREYADEQSAKASLAYRFLMRPMSRAEHLMWLNGIRVPVVDAEERITDPKLLMVKEIMGLREAVEEANDSEALEQILYQVEDKLKLWSDLFGKAFDSQKLDEAVTIMQRMTCYKQVKFEIVFKEPKLCPVAQIC